MKHTAASIMIMLCCGSIIGQTYKFRSFEAIHFSMRSVKENMPIKWQPFESLVTFDFGNKKLKVVDATNLNLSFDLLAEKPEIQANQDVTYYYVGVDGQGQKSKIEITIFSQRPPKIDHVGTLIIGDTTGAICLRLKPN